MTEKNKLMNLIYNSANCTISEAEKITDYLLENNVRVLPCKIGAPLYYVADEDPDTGEEKQHVCKCKNPIYGIMLTDEGYRVTVDKEELELCGELINTQFAYLSKAAAEKALNEVHNDD